MLVAAEDLSVFRSDSVRIFHTAFRSGIQVIRIRFRAQALPAATGCFPVNTIAFRTFYFISGNPNAVVFVGYRRLRLFQAYNLNTGRVRTVAGRIIGPDCVLIGSRVLRCGVCIAQCGQTGFQGLPEWSQNGVHSLHRNPCRL